MMKLAAVWLVLVAAVACTDSDESDALPMCTELGAPAGAALLCTQSGVCSWEGAECCGTGGTDARCPVDQAR